MSHADYRLPAEWERQTATLLAWPHAQTDWASNLDGIQDEYLALIEAISKRQTAVVLVPPNDSEAIRRIGEGRGRHLIPIPYNDTWCRDYGPITLVRTGQRLAMDFHFNGWGGKYPAQLDNRVNTLLSRHPLFERFSFRQSLFELEGGAIDSDGRGRLLVNWHCLRARHPYLSRAEITHELCLLLNVEQVLGVDIEPMSGDDTDGHIDTLVRFVSTDTLVYQIQSDPAATAGLVRQLEGLRGPGGRPYRLVGLPLPEAIDRTLPANYVNFLFVNGACLVPAYDSPTDAGAAALLQELMPDRTVESIRSRALIGQFGGIHCATMHLPAALA
ncbi:MAG: agmatine deiminase family protein [Wenzhouxiangella sp.]|jgi:agmatine/peptidylarginine deiminase|nr:agmatine deiminase family protein [Wenzhouxiangella sp.]